MGVRESLWSYSQRSNSGHQVCAFTSWAVTAPLLVMVRQSLFLDCVSLCSPGWPWPPVDLQPCSQILGLKVCTPASSVFPLTTILTGARWPFKFCFQVLSPSNYKISIIRFCIWFVILFHVFKTVLGTDFMDESVVHSEEHFGWVNENDVWDCVIQHRTVFSMCLLCAGCVCAGCVFRVCAQGVCALTGPGYHCIRVFLP